MKRYTTQLIVLLAFTALLFVAPMGCKSTTMLPGVYQGDKILYHADKSITTTYKQFQTFVAWEHEHRAVLPVEVSRVADTIRLNAKKWIDSASALRDTYAASPTVENRDKLLLTLNLIDTALDEAIKYMAQNKSRAPLNS